jgi:hypothetical protein
MHVCVCAWILSVRVCVNVYFVCTCECLFLSVHVSG